MLFNAPEYVLFLPVVFCMYWAAPRQRLRNIILLVASYIFYGWWDQRFLLLIAASSIIDFSVALGIERAQQQRSRQLLLGVSLIANLGMLAVFKYYNFFVDSLASAASDIGVDLNFTTLNIILPVGISFYTFQTLSYTIDVYRKRLKPTTDWIAFFTFVAFFPQLVAGPIERASHLLGQFFVRHEFTFKDGREGLRRILWGMFKKVVVADQCGLMVNSIFADYESLPASTLVLGAVYFAFQIYCDFSGYSDIAIGSAKLFGIDLMENFRLPYFSRDPAEFWRRWHISLSGWFRDYVYIPLGGSKCSKLSMMRNTLIVFLVSGFWHGANWTFLAWGLLHWLYFVPLVLIGTNRRNLDSIAGGERWLPKPVEFLQMAATFSLVTFAWVFFRADSISQAFDYLDGMLSSSLFQVPTSFRSAAVWVIALVCVEWVQRNRRYSLDLCHVHVILRWAIYVTLVILCLAKYSGSSQFIYFQF